MAKPKVATAALEAALGDVARGLSPVEAARKHGVGKTRLYDELKAKRDTPPVVMTSSPPTPRAPVVPPSVLEEAPSMGEVQDLERLARRIEDDLDDASEARKGPLISALRATFADIRKTRGPRPPTREELEAAAGPAADEVIAKLETAVGQREAAATAAGVCLWCRAPLELAAQLRAVLGCDDVAGELGELLTKLEAIRAAPTDGAGA